MLSKEQLALRRTGVTGTDVAALLGRSEFKSQLDVWREKRGICVDVEVTAAMKRGIYLESGIRQWYADETGASRIEEPGTLVLKGQPRVMATPDGLSFFGEERVGLEIKSPSPFMESGWGKPGTDEVPDAYLLQGVFEMAVLDVERLDFAALLGGELCIYPVRRDRELESYLIEFSLKWWRDYVEADLEPPPTARERDVAFIASKFPRATKPHLSWDELRPEQRLLVENLLAADKALKEAKGRRTELELLVKLALGEAGGVTLPDSLRPYKRIDWQTTKARPMKWTDALASVNAAYRALVETGDVASAPDFDSLLEPHRGENPRPFNLRKTKKGDEPVEEE